MTNPETAPSPALGRNRRGLKFLGVILLGVLLLILSLAAPVIREYTRPIQPLPRLDSAKAFLILAVQQGASGPATPVHQDTNATHTLPVAPARVAAENTSQGLRFKPFIPDSPAIQPELRARAIEINEKFDRVYLRIQAYERDKARLKPGEALKELERIVMDYNHGQHEIWKAAQGKLTSDTHEALEKRDMEFSSWLHAAYLEAYSRAGTWGGAGSFAESSRRLNLRQWMEEEYARNGGRPVIGADYDRQNGFRDLDRVLDCYRKQGSVNGFMNTAYFYFGRKWDAWMEWRNGGWSPEVKIKIFRVQGRR